MMILGPSVCHTVQQLMIMFFLLYGSILWSATCVSSLPAPSRIFMFARVGSSAVLPCDWRNVSSQSPHVVWRTFAETVFERRGGDLYQGEGYEDRVDVPEDHLLKGDCSLELKNVRSEDAGVYESFLLVRRKKRSLHTKRVFLQSVQLSVEETPEKSSSSSNENPAATGDARMNSPPPKIILLLPFMVALVLRRE
ncbi:hypothetical protein MHYP_G00170580 [Metynnis hypsauchen]